MKFEHTAPIFDYKALRLMLGIIALSLPFVVTFVARDSLPSISASYFTNARDVFVGALFVVGGLMLTYNGHTTFEALASKVAAVSALLVALFPTSKVACESSSTSTVHTVAAVVLFLILAYFCFGPFRENTKGKGGKKGRRAKFYFACGCLILGSMAVGLIGELVLPCETLQAIDLIYWVETVALSAFGVAWIVAGKIIPWLVDEEDALKLFKH